MLGVWLRLGGHSFPSGQETLVGSRMATGSPSVLSTGPRSVVPPGNPVLATTS